MSSVGTKQKLRQTRLFKAATYEILRGKAHGSPNIAKMVVLLMSFVGGAFAPDRGTGGLGRSGGITSGDALCLRGDTEHLG